jgi:hypothetical protein
VANKSGVYEVQPGDTPLDGCGVCAPAVSELVV